MSLKRTKHKRPVSIITMMTTMLAAAVTITNIITTMMTTAAGAATITDTTITMMTAAAAAMSTAAARRASARK